MTKYWMSKHREDEWRVWQPCLAQTLEELRIATGDNRNTSTVAIWPVGCSGWVDVK